MKPLKQLGARHAVGSWEGKSQASETKFKNNIHNDLCGIALCYYGYIQTQQPQPTSPHVIDIGSAHP